MQNIVARTVAERSHRSVDKQVPGGYNVGNIISVQAVALPDMAAPTYLSILADCMHRGSFTDTKRPLFVRDKVNLDCKLRGKPDDEHMCSKKISQHSDTGALNHSLTSTMYNPSYSITQKPLLRIHIDEQSTSAHSY